MFAATYKAQVPTNTVCLTAPDICLAYNIFAGQKAVFYFAVIPQPDI